VPPCLHVIATTVEPWRGPFATDKYYRYRAITTYVV
jgi:hypothetical protein